MTAVKTAREITSMRTSGQMLGTVLKVLERRIAAGMTTQELADIARAEVKVLGGEPAFLGYQGFPDVLCVSVNDEVVHGIPSSKRIIRDGDIVSMDFGVRYEGMITDAAVSVMVGKKGNRDAYEMLAATKASLDAGIAALRDGVQVGDVAAAIQAVLDQARLGIVRDLVGHGVGHQLHEEPNIPNFGRAGTGPVLKAGMTIAIEPMTTLGKHQVFVDFDGWTVKTRDGSLSAHFEHTILITADGSEILTEL